MIWKKGVLEDIPWIFWKMAILECRKGSRDERVAAFVVSVFCGAILSKLWRGVESLRRKMELVTFAPMSAQDWMVMKLVEDVWSSVNILEPNFAML